MWVVSSGSRRGVVVGFGRRSGNKSRGEHAQRFCDDLLSFEAQTLRTECQNGAEGKRHPDRETNSEPDTLDDVMPTDLDDVGDQDSDDEGCFETFAQADDEVW